ncbi:MAG: hypothetical protein R3B69_02930 [Candidatus Paceibacterota bacterium]
MSIYLRPIAALIAGVVLLTGAWTWFQSYRQSASLEEQILQVEAVVSGCEIGEERQLALLCLSGPQGKQLLEYAKRSPELQVVVPRLYALYGQDGSPLQPAWEQAIDRYGFDAIRVIRAYYEGGSAMATTESLYQQSLNELFAGQLPSLKVEELPASYHGAYGLLQLTDKGHRLLARFEYESDKAVYKPLTGTVGFFGDIMFGYIHGVESKLILGEDVTLGEWLGVGIEVAVPVLITTALVKGVKVALLAKGGSKVAFLKAATTGTLKATLKMGAKIAPKAAIVGAGYLVIRHPSLVATQLSWVAEQVGLPSWLGAWVGYLIFAVIILTILAFLWALTFPVRKAGALTWRLLRVVSRV